MECATTQVQFDNISDALGKVVDLKGDDYPDYLTKYFLYDQTARKALHEMNVFFYENQVPLPLFRNKLEVGQEGNHSQKVCIAVMTARREHSQIAYVVQTVSALLNRMQYKQYSDHVYIHVFNVDAEPDKHTDVDLIRHLVPVTNLKVAIPGEEAFPLGPRCHENVDYAAILRVLLDMKCQYPIFLEDDALATDNWIESIKLLIDQLESRTSEEKSWFAAKLYSARVSYPQSITPGFTSYDQGFNCVAVLMNPLHILQFAQELEQNVNNVVSSKDATKLRFKDLLMNDFVKENKLFIGSFEPVVFQHTGVYSSIIQRGLDKYSVENWFMSSKTFEAEGIPIRFDPRKWTENF